MESHINTACTECQHPFRVKVEMEGKIAKCPRCFKTFTIIRLEAKSDNSSESMPLINDDKSDRLDAVSEYKSVKNRITILAGLAVIIITVLLYPMITSIIIPKLPVNNSNFPKWLDYGSCVLNVSLYKYITSETIPAMATIEERLQNAKDNPESKAINDLSVMSYIRFDDFTLTIENTPVKSESDFDALKKRLKSNYDQVVEFLRSNETYHRLK